MRIYTWDGYFWMCFTSEEFIMLKDKKFKAIYVSEPCNSHQVLEIAPEISKRLAA